MFSFSDEPFDIFLSSTNPLVMRYHLLNSDSDECVRLGMYYINQNRLEVYVDGVYVQPNNGYTDSNGRFRLHTQSTNNEYMPDVSNKNNGENFLRSLFVRQCLLLFMKFCYSIEPVFLTGKSAIEMFLLFIIIIIIIINDFLTQEFVENILASGLDHINQQPSSRRQLLI